MLAGPSLVRKIASRKPGTRRSAQRGQREPRIVSQVRPDIRTSRIMRAASVAALLALAAETGGAVLESVWHRSRALGDLHPSSGQHRGGVCRCDQQTAARRYALRAGTRAAGHFAAERTIEELWNDEVAQPVAGGWPVIEIGTNSPVDVSPLTMRIRTVASATRRK